MVTLKAGFVDDFWVFASKILTSGCISDAAVGLDFEKSDFSTHCRCSSNGLQVVSCIWGAQNVFLLGERDQKTADSDPPLAVILKETAFTKVEAFLCPRRLCPDLYVCAVKHLLTINTIGFHGHSLLWFVAEAARFPASGTANPPVCWVDTCHSQLNPHSGALRLYPW